MSNKEEGIENILMEIKDFGRKFDSGEIFKLIHPFHTTKPDGLKMGLPISRSTCEACGGRLWAAP